MADRNDSVKAIREEKRDSFRINDSLQVVVRRIEGEAGFFEPDNNAEPMPETIPTPLENEKISLTLWKMLVNLDRKLDRIMERMPVDLLTTQSQPVNLSSTGMKIKVKKNFGIKEPLRIKMLLPTLPVKELVLTGKVVRIASLADGEYEVALHFQDLDDTVKNEIIQYTLNQQRKTLAAQKHKRGQE